MAAFLAPIPLASADHGTFMCASLPIVQKRVRRTLCTSATLQKSVTSQNVLASLETGLFACTECGATLPDTPKTGTCLRCGAERTVTKAGFTDFKPDGRRPQSVRTFQQPLVAWMYERGWRSVFESQGFPGPDAEVRAASAHIGTNRDSRVLDCSCASGLLTRRLSTRYNRVIGLDYSAAMLSEALRRGPGEYVRADVSHMPFVDNAFDGVVAGAAIHCWPSPQDALHEIHRVLKPGGAFYATTFARDAYEGRIRITLNLPVSSQYRFFWPDEVRWLCKAAGFVDVDVQCVKSFIAIRCRK